MTEIKNIVFDVGNVLVDFRPNEYLDELGFTEEIKTQLKEKVFDSNIWRERDRGYKTEEEYIEEFVEAAPELEEEIRLMFQTIGRVVEPYAYSTEWVKGMKQQGKNTYILSNYSKDLFEYGLENYEFFQYIDGITVSYEVHQLKPEEEIYKSLLERHHLKPDETVFMDDIKENVEAAARCGIHTIHVTSHEAAVKGLQSYGVESKA